MMPKQRYHCKDIIETRQYHYIYIRILLLLLIQYQDIMQGNKVKIGATSSFFVHPGISPFGINLKKSIFTEY